jgi:hypothetical protein
LNFEDLSANGPRLLDPVAGKKGVTLSWEPPTLVPTGIFVVSYSAYRVEGRSVTNEAFLNRVLVGQTSATTVVDADVRAKKSYTYFVVVDFSDGTRALSNYATFTN